MSATLSTAETSGTEDKGVSPLAEGLFAPQGDSSKNSRIDNLLSTQQLRNNILYYTSVTGLNRYNLLMLPYLRVN
jgi:hypothetical protein